MNRSKGTGLLIVILLVVGIFIYFKYFANADETLPDLNKTIFIDGTYTQSQNTYRFETILNNDLTGSIICTDENNSAEHGTWKMVMQNDEMIKIELKTGANYLIILYKNKAASIAEGNVQINGKWRQ
ncbi:hypothetical protein I5677_08455 [Mobilitalea sibirica]|uniref:Uncharacterized protein n=1 Tax=Mobilitalea sibirica TaxID=1462919 RepID=A0A8J7H2D3_9FIRM|nr:hypothetical protein [Mobilitalea sibirica]MBH1940919.1 hypothetical protein [Mobilitalea sibirica]